MSARAIAGRISMSRFESGVFPAPLGIQRVRGDRGSGRRGDGRRSGCAPRLPVLNSIAPMAPCSVETNARACSAWTRRTRPASPRRGRTCASRRLPPDPRASSTRARRPPSASIASRHQTSDVRAPMDRCGTRRHRLTKRVRRTRARSVDLTPASTHRDKRMSSSWHQFPVGARQHQLLHRRPANAHTGGTRTTNSERPRTNAMSGPGLFEPGEEYVPAGIKPVVDEATLPTAPAAGGEELWLIQIPGDADPADLDGLRFRISDEGNGPEISQFKVGGESFIAFEPPSASHPRPCRPPPSRPPQQPSPPAALFAHFSADEPDPLPLTGRREEMAVEGGRCDHGQCYVRAAVEEGWRKAGVRRAKENHEEDHQEQAKYRESRRNIGFEDAVANEEGAKTPGEKKEKNGRRIRTTRGTRSPRRSPRSRHL